MKVAAKLLIATGNYHKVSEIRNILKDYEVELICLEDIDPQHTIPEASETGHTYLANALQKAHHYAKYTNLACLADDSGLEIDALNGAPGLYSHRFCPGMTQLEKNAYVLEKLKDLPDEERRAHFHCTAVICPPPQERAIEKEPEYYTYSANCPGRIARQSAGTEGFGYDPIFYIPAKKACLAELSAAEKNAISHRGQAMRGLIDLYLKG